MAEFIANNIIWILIFVVLIIMAIIGYFADKQGLVESNSEKKKEEPKEEPVSEEDVATDNELVFEENTMEQTEEVTEDNYTMEEAETYPTEEVSYEEPTTEVAYEAAEPEFASSVENYAMEETTASDFGADASMYAAPMVQTENTFATEPVVEQQVAVEEEQKDDFGMSALPSLHAEEPINESSNPEDVWKF